MLKSSQRRARDQAKNGGVHFLKASGEHLRAIFPPSCLNNFLSVISHLYTCLQKSSLAFQMSVEVLMADDIRYKDYPTAGSAALFFRLGFRPRPPLLSPSVSVRLKPIVAQATGMNVMVTPLLFSLSIKSKMAQTQFTVRLFGTPPLFSTFTHKTRNIASLIVRKLAVFHIHTSVKSFLTQYGLS